MKNLIIILSAIMVVFLCWYISQDYIIEKKQQTNNLKYSKGNIEIVEVIKWVQ